MIAVAGLALLATSATAPTTPVKVSEKPPNVAPVESLPRGRVTKVDPPPVFQPVAVAGLDETGPTIPVTFTGEIPATLLDAYRRARDAVNLAQPGCRLPMELLAAIGKVETNHARGGQVDSNGTALRPILGPVLDGAGFAAVPDTDGGLLDGDTKWDRALGPMQFLPPTWRRWEADGNGDHRADPNNVYDASLAAANYLCAGNRDLATPQGLDEAILSYNHSASYRSLVLSWMATYTNGTVIVPDTVGGPVPAVLHPPASSTPPAAQPVGGAQPTPTPPPSPTRPPAATPPPASEPAPPSSPALPPPPVPILTVVCDLGASVTGIVTGIVGAILGPITGTSEPPPCSTVAPNGTVPVPTPCPAGLPADHLCALTEVAPGR